MKLQNYVINVLATFLYTGYLPVAPGTWASLIAMVVWFLLPPIFYLRLLLFGIVAIIGVLVADRIETRTGIIDPSYVVIDEVAGMWLALLLLPQIAFPENITVIILTFAIFRLLDISKFLFIKKLERIGGGMGIMADDIIAGLLAGGMVNLLLWIW